MALVDRVFALTIMGLILLFSLIHLGVSIGLIVKDRKYGDFFRPQIGLSSFNLVIFIFSLFAGVLGIIALALNSERFARIVCIISGVVGIFALASLVSAIVINDKSPSYVHSRFLNGQNRYNTDSDLRNKIDILQNKYQCCGNDIWLDWANADLAGTSTNTNTTTAQPSTAASSGDNTTVPMTTTTATTTTTTATISMSTSSSIPATTTISSSSEASAMGKKKRDLDSILSNQNEHDLHESVVYSRSKRQAAQNYGGILGLPVETFSVVLPQSCCTEGATLTGNSSDAYCVSNQNGVVNHFRTTGCSRLIERDAGNQAMAFIIINSFMTVLAFIAIPVMLGKPSDLV